MTLEAAAVELTGERVRPARPVRPQPGAGLHPPELLNQVWGYQYEGDEHTVNSHINRLRAKIERDPAHHPMYLQTVWGVGYRFAEPQGIPGREQAVPFLLRAHRR